LVAAALATFTGLAAVQVIGDGITAPVGRPLSQEQVAQALASPPPSAAPSAPPTNAEPTDGGPTGGGGPTGAAGNLRAIRTAAGTVVARCEGNLVTLQSWTPGQGYAVRDVERGPDDDAEVTFEGGDGELEVTVTCVDGMPSATTEAD
jgi:hypothetical protein